MDAKSRRNTQGQEDSSAVPPPAAPVPAEASVSPYLDAQARLAAIIESSDDAIISKSLEGTVMSWNQGAQRIFGWTAEEMIGRPITTIIPPDRHNEEPQILRRIRSGERLDHFSTIRQTKDGRRIDVSVTISPVFDDQRRIIGVSKIARDITPEKRAQQELAASKQAAEQARESAEAANRAKDYFLSVLSHELRTPLTPVLGAISIMQSDPTLPPHLAEHLEMIRRNVETEARLVDDLLDLTRIARGKIRLSFEVADLHAILRNIVAMMQPEIDEKALSLTLSFHARQHHAWVDPGRFQQIVLNLLSNAVKFTPPHGSIFIRTGNEDGGVLRIDVADSGIGIDTELIPRLFRPFEQADQSSTRQFGGLGLGLSIVKSLVEMHKASISVSSEGPNRGATFTLRMDTVTAAPKAPAAGPAIPRVGRQYRILLVEDHRDTRRVLSSLLAGLGYVVTQASSVREAIEAAEHERFDVVLSDIGLPDGSGIDVMRNVSARQPIKGIAISGYGQDADLRRSQEAGFTTHLTKPVNLQTLHECILSVTDQPMVQ